MSDSAAHILFSSACLYACLVFISASAAYSFCISSLLFMCLHLYQPSFILCSHNPPSLALLLFLSSKRKNVNMASHVYRLNLTPSIVSQASIDYTNHCPLCSCELSDSDANTMDCLHVYLDHCVDDVSRNAPSIDSSGLERVSCILCGQLTKVSTLGGGDR